MDKALQTLGIAYRAKKLVFGEDVLNNLSSIKLMIIASDISEKSRIRFEKKCNSYNIDILDSYTSEQLSNALGKNVIKVIGITDEGFKKSILDK